MSNGTVPVPLTETEPPENAAPAKAIVPGVSSPAEAWGSCTCHRPHQISTPVTPAHTGLEEPSA
ncbi:MAG: hypothetical protein ACYC0E_05395 [Acidimicrobiales bacterium]